jgi:hypothetical protein
MIERLLDYPTYLSQWNWIHLHERIHHIVEYNGYSIWNDGDSFREITTKICFKLFNVPNNVVIFYCSSIGIVLVCNIFNLPGRNDANAP